MRFRLVLSGLLAAVVFAPSAWAVTPTEGQQIRPGTALSGPCQNSDATTGAPFVETLFFYDDGPPAKNVSHSQPFSGEGEALGMIQPTNGCQPQPSRIVAPLDAGWFDMRIDTVDSAGNETYNETFFHVGCDCATTMSTAGRNRLEDEESFVGHPYNDQDGYCTIGIGHLLHYSACTPADFKQWKGVTRAELDDLFRRDLPKYEGYVVRMDDTLKLEQTQCEFDALVNLAFNAGPAPFAPSSGIYKSLKEYAPIGGQLGVEQAIYHEDWGSTKQRAARKNRTPATVRDLATRHAQIATEFATFDCPCRLP
jgi:GH24 family phage-related lysozyme (muramidase)